MLSYESGLELVAKQDYVLLAGEESIRVLPEFTCDIALVDNFVFDIKKVAMPFRPGSHLKSAFSTEILKLKSQGILDRL